MPFAPLHVGLSVADIDESIGWYREHLGFEVVSREYIAPLKCDVCFLSNGIFAIELFRHDETVALPPERREPDSDIQTQGTKHICYACDDVASFVETLKRKGADVVFGPRKMNEDVIAYVRDNNGILIEFIQKPA